MTDTAPRKLSADAVCAFCWAHAGEKIRGAYCKLAKVSEVYALLNWYELSRAQRDALRPVLAEAIEANDARQRAEWEKQSRCLAARELKQTIENRNRE